MENTGGSSEASELTERVHDAQVAREQAREVQTKPQERKLLFVLRISEILVGLPASSVQSVIAADTPCSLPMAPAHVLGLVPYSEGALAVLDLARFLELGTTAVDTRSGRIVVVRCGELEAGLLCDQALGVHSADGDEIDRECIVHGGQLATYTVFECQLPLGRVASLDHARLLQAMQLRG